jgi:hypothetical protein
MKRVWLAALALAGCMSTDPGRWSYAPDAETQVKRDIYECKADTDAMLYRAANFGGAVVPLVALSRASSAFDRCMESRGYRKP